MNGFTETFTTKRGTSIIVHRSDLTEEEREERMKEIEKSATRLMKCRREKQ